MFFPGKKLRQVSGKTRLFHWFILPVYIFSEDQKFSTFFQNLSSEQLKMSMLINLKTETFTYGVQLS